MSGSAQARRSENGTDWSSYGPAIASACRAIEARWLRFGLRAEAAREQAASFARRYQALQ